VVFQKASPRFFNPNETEGDKARNENSPWKRDRKIRGLRRIQYHPRQERLKGAQGGMGGKDSLVIQG